MKIFLDTKPLWTAVHPGGGPEASALRSALQRRQLTGDEIAVAEICDYEARRELLRRRATRQLQNLEAFIQASLYYPLETKVMREAAALWAQIRAQGRPTAPDDALDGDVILAAQVSRISDHLVVTSNVKHLASLCNTIEITHFIQAS